MSVTKRDLLLAVFGSVMVLTMRTPSVLSSSLPLFGFFSPLLFLVVGVEERSNFKIFLRTRKIIVMI